MTGVDYPAEFSFLLRYPAKHGRSNTRTLWSLRQVAMYRRYNTETQHTTTVLLQCPEIIRDFILEGNSGQKGNNKDDDDRFSIATELISFATLQWKTFIVDLETELMAMVYTTHQSPDRKSVVKLNQSRLKGCIPPN